MRLAGKLVILVIGASIFQLIDVGVIIAQEASPTSARALPGRDRWQPRPPERIEHLEKLRGRPADLTESREERVEVVAGRLADRLGEIIGRFTSIIGRLHQHIARIQARADDLNDQPGVDTSAVDAALASAQTHLSLAEQAASDLKDEIGALEDATTPRAIVATFRGGMAQIRSHLLAAREQIRGALRMLVSLAGESRLTTTPARPPAL